MAKKERNESRRIRRSKRKNCKIILMVTFALFMVLGFSGTKSYIKIQDYKKQEFALVQAIEEANRETINIEEHKEYTQTDAYIEEVAKEKLGMGYPGEIILKPVQ